MNQSSNGAKSALSPYYKAVYRWHFFAGMVVLPFIVLIAITGLIYLFHSELDEFIYHDYYFIKNMNHLEHKPSHQEIVNAAQKQVAGRVAGYIPARDHARAAEVIISEGENSHHNQGKKVSVFINPLNVEANGIITETKIMQIIKKIHSMEYFGTAANYCMEIISGLVIILVISGFYLWFPRRQAVGSFAFSETNPKKRLFWRDLHAVSGFYIGLVILFLAITGMFWSVFWGDGVNRYFNQAQIGYPPQFWEAIPESFIPENATKIIIPNINWSGENIPMPTSAPPKIEYRGVNTISIDKAVTIFNDLGIAKGYEITYPVDDLGVYSATIFPKNVADEQVIHLDQYSGNVLFNNKYADIPWGARLIEWSISVHQGHEYGVINQIIMAIACIGLLGLAGTGIVQWAKRKPAGRIAAPPRQDSKTTLIIWLCIMAIGVLYPLTGVTMVVGKIIMFFMPKKLFY